VFSNSLYPGKYKRKILQSTKRIAELEKLAPKAAKTWERAIELIGLKQAKSYDEAISLLIDLRDLARHQKRLPEFSQRLEQLKLDYSNRSALIKRLKSIDV
jgi:tRNA/tmRNA/rRNA uracil-C5-methylase (TrmA/RlmC/RlmD family)